MTRSYSPGFRNKPDFENNPGKFSENRWAWVKVYFGQFIIVGTRKTNSDEIMDIKVTQPIPNRSAVTWNLTALTEEELVAMQHLFNTAFAWALPICQQRDKEAQDALDNGDDSHSRIYRQVPQLVYRSGPEQQHGQGVHDGPEDAAGAPQPDLDSDGELRDAGSDVAEQHEGTSGPQDDGS